MTRNAEEQTGIHLLMAAIVSVFSVLLILVTIVMKWELWIIPLALMGIVAIWSIHIGKMVADTHFEYLCVGWMLIGFFYYGVHADSLFDMPMIACVLFFMLALLNRKSLLYLVDFVYFLVLLYHLLFLRTIGLEMGSQNLIKLGVGIVVTLGAMVLSNTLINRRRKEHKGMGEIEKQLETARRQNADFLANVSHELRTPINMVSGISEVALEMQLPPEIRESMQSVQLAGKRLAGQINDILDYTEIVGNSLVVTNENYMPSSVLHDVVTAAIAQNCDSGLEMIFDLDTRIPSVLVGDADKICRVLRLLIQNAIKFTEEGGIYVHVGFRRESYGINLDITICDTGIGMTSEQLARIYDDFYQADSGRSRCAGGLGLGVPIARGLLHAMEGFLHYISSENHGTEVHISLPQGVADETPCMVVSQPERFCIACYFKQDKYSRSEVRQYYDNMILHLAGNLDLQAYRAYHFEDMVKLRENHPLTHLFLAQEEYVEHVSYFEKLGKDICVALIADAEFELGADSSLIVIHKPFFALPIVNLLNGVTHPMNQGEGRAFFCEGVRTLVVDDEEMNLVVAKGILGSYGFQVDTCTGGAEAVEQCKKTLYDLIFLDHMMPGMDGVETLRQIRHLRDGSYQNLPIIALTANAISGAREMFKSEGFTEFVPKPIERPVLERALRRVLPEQNIRYLDTLDSEKKDGNVELTTGQFQEKPEKPDKSAPGGQFAGTLESLRLSGINVEVGLRYCGDEEFYLEMLKMYCTEHEAKCQELITLYENGDWADYAIKAHALKSTSLTIGAEEVSQQAKALELAGKSEDIAFIRENHEKLLQSHRELCQLLADTMAMEDRR